LLEGRRFSEKDFIDSFINGLKDEIKPFVITFKPHTLDAALEYALYMESTTETQFKRMKFSVRVLPTTQMMPKFPDKNFFNGFKGPLASLPQKGTSMDQRRALRLCFKCGNKY
jgi:hypothetical protein